MRKAEADDSIHLIEAALRNFVCSKDADIEQFLHEKAIPFQQRKLCSTYLIVDEDAFRQGEIYIEAYFTLSHKSIVVPPDLSKQKVRTVAGFKDASSIHFVLIGQLG